MNKNIEHNLAKIMEAISKVYRVYPEYKNVVRENSLYRTKSPVIGIRVTWNEDHISTVYINPNHNYKKIAQRILYKAKKIQSKPYEFVYQSCCNLNVPASPEYQNLREVIIAP
jgi:hypothetical protein